MNESNHNAGTISGQPSKFEKGIVCVVDLLTSTSVSIPEYQRPYKWTARHVNQLVDDVLHFRDKPAYRLGTIVFHQNDEQSRRDIVDGQQRTITLALLVRALMKETESRHEKLFASLFSIDERERINQLLNTLKLTGDISHRNVFENYREMRRRVMDFDEKAVEFLLLRCELVQVTLYNLSEAFQFFDSQNARGKDLDPHDLLKAYHLREMSESATEAERIRAVDKWEKFDTDKLKELFSLYLFRIRNWAKGKEARHFNKADIDVFKGVSPQNTQGFPFSEIHRIAHFFTEQYNADYVRQIDRHRMPYPFQLDQVMVNGRRFFEFVDHYNEKLSVLNHLLAQDTKFELNENSRTILETLNTYEGRNRTGDRYVLNLFQCALLFFTDKFGWAEIDRAIEKFFLWAYRVRLEYRNVQLATLDNYAIGKSSSTQNVPMFSLIHEAVQPEEVLNVRLKMMPGQNQSTDTDKVWNLFNERGYAE